MERKYTSLYKAQLVIGMKRRENDNGELDEEGKLWKNCGKITWHVVQICFICSPGYCTCERETGE